MSAVLDPAPAWRLEVTAERRAVAAVEAALEGVCMAVSSFGDNDTDGPWRIEGYTDREPDIEAIAAGLEMTCRSIGAKAPALRVEFLTPRDWLAENLAAFEPIRVDRFFVYPSHYDGPLPPATIPFRIDAGTAFGSGTHPTTATCMQALANLARTIRVRNVLDLGCGSGILSFAAARLWPAEVLAVDIDPEAVKVTRRNAADNGIGRRVMAVRSNGYQSDAVRRRAPFDLIVANVLARPLIAMAGDAWQSLRPGGWMVLSGLLERDARWVMQRHVAQGFVRADVLTHDDWATLILRRPDAGRR